MPLQKSGKKGGLLGSEGERLMHRRLVLEVLEALELPEERAVYIWGDSRAEGLRDGKR